MKINYENFRSSSQQKEIEDLLEVYGSIIPSYVKTLNVINWDDVSDGENRDFASITYTPKYLEATLNIYNRFFSNKEQVKRLTIIHELLHIHVGRINSLVRDDVIKYVATKNEDLSIFMDRSYIGLEEEFVEHFANFILDRS